jgi:hypothetical protein
MDDAVTRRRLTDARYCPSCDSPLAGPLCGRCGVDLSGEAGDRLWRLSTEAEALLQQREAVIAQLRAMATRPAATSPASPAATSPAAPAATSPAAPAAAATSPAPASAPAASTPDATTRRAWEAATTAVPQVGSRPSAMPPFQLQQIPMAPSRPSLLSRIGVQGLLISVGALMVAVAGIVFLVVAWDRLGLSGRALVIATLTVAAMAAAVRLRPKLPETAEGIGAIAAVLVLADAWAVRATGLWGTDRWHWSGYLALAGGLCTALLYAWGRRFGVRAGTITAAVAAPASVVTAGLWLGSHHGFGGTFGAGLGLSAASALGLLRHWVPPTWRTERFVLVAAAAGGWALAAMTTLVASPYSWRQSIVLALGAIGAAAQARFTRAPRPGPTTGSASMDRLNTPRALWAMGAGATAAAAVSPLPVTQLSGSQLSGSQLPGSATGLAAGVAVTWYPLLAPALAALVAAAIAWSTRPGRWLHRLASLPHRPATAAARFVAVALTMPALLTVAGLVGGSVAAGFDSWHAGAMDRLDHVIDPVALENLWFHGDSRQLPLTAGLGLLALAVLLEVGVRLGASGATTGGRLGSVAAGRSRWSAAAMLAAGAGALPLALQPRWPLWVAVTALLLVAVGFGYAAGHPIGGRPLGDWHRRAAVAVSAVAGTVAVLLSWSANALSVPATLVGVVALLGARRAAPVAVRPALIALAALATTVAAGALTHFWGGDPAVRFRTASVVASLLTGLFAAVPTVAGRIAVGTRTPPRIAAWFADRSERLTGAAVSWSAACLAALLGVASGDNGFLSHRTFQDSSQAQGLGLGDVVVAAALLAAVLVAVRALPDEAPAGRLVPMAAAGMLATTTAVLSLSVVQAVMLRSHRGVSADRLSEASNLATAGAVALVGLGIGLLGARGWRDGRRVPAEIGLAVPLALLALTAATDWGRYPTSWVVLLLLGVAATAVSIPADRHQVAWAGWVLLTASSGVRLLRSDVGLVEAYTLPPALALLAVSAYRLRRDRSTQAWSTLAPGVGLAVLPSVFASGDGSVVRPIVLIAGGALAVAGVWTQTVSRRLDVVAMAAAVTAAGGAATARTLAIAGQESWPSLAQLEAWTAPASLVVVAAGLHLLIRRSTLGSLWPTVPGLALLLAPSVLAVLDGQPLWRVVWVSVAAAAVLVAGVVRRLRGPVLIGAAALTVHAVAQLGPWVVRTAADMPRWLSLAVVGVLVLGLGTTYERRLRELKAVRLSLSGLR